MRYMARCSLAQGCKAICWFMFHDRDCWGAAPVSSHGHVRPSLGVLSETVELATKLIRNWDRLTPHMDIAVVYDLLQHQHTAIGDPMPCADNNLHIGRPAIEGTQAGMASAEYLGLFRLVEENGFQAGAVDILHRPKGLNDFPLAFLPGSPGIERAVARALTAYVKSGGVLVVTGPWPQRDERGDPIAFFHDVVSRAKRAAVKFGRGSLVWHPDFIAQDKPEEESQASLDTVRGLLARHAGKPAVGIRPVRPVSWVDWVPEGGHGVYAQPRNLGSAVLHEGDGERIVYVLNHYPEAAAFEISFGSGKPRRLTNLSTGETHDVEDNLVVLDIDRKSVEIYRVDD